MQYIFELNMKVRDYEVDSEGIVNNAIYLHYMEHTRHEFCEWAGLSFRQMHASGIDPVIARSEVRYLKPLSLGEHFISKIAISRRGPLFVFFQDIFTPDGEPIAKGIIEVACIENGRLTRGDVLAKAFERYFTDHDA